MAVRISSLGIYISPTFSARDLFNEIISAVNRYFSTKLHVYYLYTTAVGIAI
jgi:hypothetical protein